MNCLILRLKRENLASNYRMMANQNSSKKFASKVSCVESIVCTSSVVGYRVSPGARAIELAIEAI